MQGGSELGQSDWSLEEEGKPQAKIGGEQEDQGEPHERQERGHGDEERGYETSPENIED